MKRIILCVLVAGLLAGQAFAETSSSVLWLYNKTTGTDYQPYQYEVKDMLSSLNSAATTELYNAILSGIQGEVKNTTARTLQKKQQDIEKSIYQGYKLPLSNLLQLEAEYAQVDEELKDYLTKSSCIKDIPLMQPTGVNIQELSLDIYKKTLQAEKEKGKELGEVKAIKSILTNGFKVHTAFGTQKNSGGSSYFHSGVDLTAPEGAIVGACFTGTVLEVGEDSYNGKYVRINHGDGIQSYYANLRTVKVTVGDEVQQYAEVGTVGSEAEEHEGLSYLHFALYINRDAVDPQILFKGAEKNEDKVQ